MSKGLNIFKSASAYLKTEVFSSKSFGFVLFLTILAVLSIRAGHSVDEKVLEISVLENELKELEAEYLESKSKLMQLGMESQVIKRGEEIGLQASSQPPKRVALKID